jgi:hypothetical protein
MMIGRFTCIPWHQDVKYVCPEIDDVQRNIRSQS